MDKIRWGVLSTAKIGTEKVIPATQKSQFGTVVAIASRDGQRAKEAADRLDIPTAHDSYEALLADDQVDAVYNPLPNHLHVDWTIAALEAGKHVLCEKPIGLTAAQGQRLLDAARQHPQLKVMEAFMYRHHPQWVKAKELVNQGQIGELRAVDALFSYHNVDAANIRNLVETGGGGLMDIGCYCISVARFLFDSEPLQVSGTLDLDPAFKTDRLAAGVLKFSEGFATFTCSTQLVPYQRVQILGTTGRVEIEIPFNAPPDKPCRLWHTQGDTTEEISFPICNQYTIQADQFAQAVLQDTAVPTPLVDAVANMRVIEALKHSSESGQWHALG